MYVCQKVTATEHFKNALGKNLLTKNAETQGYT